eukprot:scaffold115_cov172-Amphora_coffeaeformis.AAC.8
MGNLSRRSLLDSTAWIGLDRRRRNIALVYSSEGSHKTFKFQTSLIGCYLSVSRVLAKKMIYEEVYYETNCTWQPSSLHRSSAVFRLSVAG